MHTINHPKLPVLRQIATQAAAIIDPSCPLIDDPSLETVPDGLLLSGWSVWPLYPEIASTYSLPGSHVWKLPDRYCFGVESYVAHAYEKYREEGVSRGDISYDRVCTPHFFETLAKKIGTPR